MTSPPRLARSIRFALSNLSSQNAHHEFEHLCREIARRRVTSNVIPATGPVAAGGDQGRDFETFHTYLRDQLPFAIGFLALAAEDTVAFACTLQEGGIASKIRADVKAICSTGTPVDRVVVFAATNVPVGARHALQEQARDEHNVPLEIFDGEAIAGLLADPELFWIAEEYLHLPAELHPPAPTDELALPDWYTALRDGWQAHEEPPASMGDLLELARGLRHAAYHREARSDLPGWVSLVERLLENAPGQEARQRARYEIVMSTLSGTSDLRPAEQHVQAFFAEIDSIDNPALLFNASVLMQACEGAYGVGATDITLEQAAIWNAEARLRVATLLADGPPPNRRAALLEAAAHLALHFDYASVVIPAPDAIANAEAITQAILAAVEAGDDIPAMPSDTRFLDVDSGMARLAELVELLPRAPMFPVDMVATLFDMLSPALIDHPQYRAVRDSLDAATTSQAGGDAVADRCRRRAQALRAANRLLDALGEFHEAKVNWWHGDILGGSLLAMGVIADIYGKLRMPLAAKNYALAMAAEAMAAGDRDLRELVPCALFLAATYDHQAGAWITSAETTAVAALAQVNYAADPGDSERYPYIQTAVMLQAFTLMAAQQHQPALVEPLREILGSWFGQFIDFALAQVRDKPAWEEEKWISAPIDMTAPPFSDAGPQRVIMFEVLGLRWTVRCRTDHATVLATEAFAAAVQVLLVELAARDPLLLPGEVQVEVRLGGSGDSGSLTAEPTSDDSGQGWVVSAPAVTSDNPEENQLRLLALLVDILMAHSLLPAEQFMVMVEDAFKAGLIHKLSPGRSYQELADLRGPDYQSPAEGVAAHQIGQDIPFPSRCAAELEAPTTSGPGYTREKSFEAIRERYKRLVPPIRHTVPRLLTDLRIRALFAKLRSAGWKDWHLLVALANLVIHTRVVSKFGEPTWGTRNLFGERYLAELNRPEEPDDPPIATETVTREVLEEALHRSLISTLQSWELEIHQPTASPDAVLQILADRYGYWTDDVEHENLFAWDEPR